MRTHLFRIGALIGMASIAGAYAPDSAAGQGIGTLAPAIGTTAKYRGWEDRDTGCQQYFFYEQHAKVAGRVILPETKANVFYFVETWGRENGTVVFRFAPQGDLVQYHRGAEGRTLVRGPVGTFSELTDPESGNTLRYEIVQDGLTVAVPAGTFENVARLEVYCMTCGPEPVLLERFYLSPEVAFPIRSLEWDAQNSCWSHWQNLVSISEK